MTPPTTQPVAPIAPNPFTFDAVTKVHTQLPKTPESRSTQVPRAHTVHTYHAPIEVPTLVPGLDPKRTLLSSFNDVVSYEAYRLDDKRQDVRSSNFNCAETERKRKRLRGSNKGSRARQR